MVVPDVLTCSRELTGTTGAPNWHTSAQERLGIREAYEILDERERFGAEVGQ